MECKSCGGEVLWIGPLTNLSHTECQNCGAKNMQVVEEEEADEADSYGYTRADEDWFFSPKD